MSGLSATQLASAICIPPARADYWLKPLNDAMVHYNINTSVRIAAFIAQVGYESNRLTAVSENLNYSADGLLKTFPKYFTPEQATQYAHKPIAIANRVYANRYGNGNEASGDGWRTRGRGLTQLTFTDNYAAYTKDSGNDVVTNPDLLIQPAISADAAGWFWDKGACRDRATLSHAALDALALVGMHEGASLNDLADLGLFEVITLCINGGLNGEADRLTLWANTKAVLTDTL